MVIVTDERGGGGERGGDGGPSEPGHPARAAARRLRQQTAEIASAFDPTGLVPLEAKATLEDLSAVAKISATLVTLAAKAVKDASAFEPGQDRSADHFVSRTLGTSVKNARDLLETAEALQSLPATEAAARRGELSGDQAQAVTKGASANPGAEGRLLDAARRGSLGSSRTRLDGSASPPSPIPRPEGGGSTSSARCAPTPTRRVRSTSISPISPRPGPRSKAPSIR